MSATPTLDPLSSTETLVWLLALPAAAECIASVWVPDWSLGGVDAKLLFLNVSGAMLEGLFSAWDGGRAAPPPGAVGTGIASLSGVMRGAFIAAYTSSHFRCVRVSWPARLASRRVRARPVDICAAGCDACFFSP